MAMLLLAACDVPASDGGCSDVHDGGQTAPLDGGSATPARTFDALGLLADPYLPARMLPGRMHLASSREPEPAAGMGNHDWSNYLATDDDELVLMQASGPGVVTRLWFTGREPATLDYTVIDRTILHAEIDGEEVAWTSGASGISLGELTSGALPGFPRPWVAGRDLATDGLVVLIPIPFARSIRLWIEPPPGVDTLFYYQVDWRSLPASTVVEPFDGVVSEAEAAALDAAAATWIDRTTEPEASEPSEDTIPPGESIVRSLSEPTIVRSIGIDMLTGTLDALDAELRVDGERVVTGPLETWAFAMAPTGSFDTALASVEPGSLVRFRYPFPVRQSAELVLTNRSAAPITVRSEIAHDPGEPSADLGSLRIECSPLTSPAVGENTTLMDLTDRRGQYAGQSLILRSPIEGYQSGLWALEGDHELTIDDDEILGTGMEDYFGGAFYYGRGPFSLPLSSSSGIVGETRVQISQVRHHFLGSIPFDRRFRFSYESFVAGTHFDACVFWYEDLRLPDRRDCSSD